MAFPSLSILRWKHARDGPCTVVSGRRRGTQRRYGTKVLLFFTAETLRTQRFFGVLNRQDGKSAKISVFVPFTTEMWRTLTFCGLFAPTNRRGGPMWPPCL